MTAPRFVRAALWCYPPWWQAIYGAEVRQLTSDLLDAGRHPLRLGADLFRGAVAARVGAHGMPARLELWTARTRASIAAATLPWVAALPLVLLGLAGPARTRNVSGPATNSIAGSLANHVATDAFQTLRTCVLVGLIAGLVGWRALRWGVSALRARRRWREVLLLCVPVLVLAILVVLLLAYGHERAQVFARIHGRTVLVGGNPQLARIFVDTAWVVLFLGGVATVAAEAALARRLDLPWAAFISGRRVATAMTALLVVMTLCAIAGAVASGHNGQVVTALPYFPAGSPGTHFVIRTYAPNWTMVGAPLGVATVISCLGWDASRRGRRVLEALLPPSL